MEENCINKFFIFNVINLSIFESEFLLFLIKLVTIDNNGLHFLKLLTVC